MKKIMFSERYGLGQAVLAGKKTMTRRVITIPEKWHGIEVYGFCHVKGQAALELTDGDGFCIEDQKTRQCAQILPTYRIGEEVAIAQNYKTCWDYYKAQWEARGDLSDWHTPDAMLGDAVEETKGYRNKMYVKAEYMPHRIRITNIKLERLQNISEEDAMQEGVFKYDKPPLHHEADMFAPWPPYVRPYKWDKDNLIYRCTARYAFAYLIDRISGRDTWQSNPWVYAYTFELIK